MSQGRKIDRATRVGAVADYLVGVKLSAITARWGVHPATLTNWVRDARCFVLRRDAGQAQRRPSRQ